MLNFGFALRPVSRTILLQLRLHDTRLCPGRLFIGLVRRNQDLLVHAQSFSSFRLHLGPQVTLGSRILFAPDVHIYAATHSTDVAERRAGLERAYPVTIGDDGESELATTHPLVLMVTAGRR